MVHVMWIRIGLGFGVSWSIRKSRVSNIVVLYISGYILFRTEKLKKKGAIITSYIFTSISEKFSKLVIIRILRNWSWIVRNFNFVIMCWPSFVLLLRVLLFWSVCQWLYKRLIRFVLHSIRLFCCYVNFKYYT